MGQIAKFNRTLQDKNKEVIRQKGLDEAHIEARNGRRKDF